MTSTTIFKAGQVARNMKFTDKNDLSPFGKAALALDADFLELERLSGQLERLEIESESGLERAEQLLGKFAQCGQRITEGVAAFAAVLEEARLRAERAAHVVAARATLIRARRQENNRLLERFQTLSETVRTFTSLLAAARNPTDGSLSTSDYAALRQRLPEIDSQLGALVEEATRLKADARIRKMKTLEREVASLEQNLSAARRKVASIPKSRLN